MMGYPISFFIRPSPNVAKYTDIIHPRQIWIIQVPQKGRQTSRCLTQLKNVMYFNVNTLLVWNFLPTYDWRHIGSSCFHVFAVSKDTCGNAYYSRKQWWRRSSTDSGAGKMWEKLFSFFTVFLIPVISVSLVMLGKVKSRVFNSFRTLTENEWLMRFPCNSILFLLMCSRPSRKLGTARWIKNYFFSTCSWLLCLASSGNDESALSCQGFIVLDRQ